jgi:hypothetical protein
LASEPTTCRFNPTGTPAHAECLASGAPGLHFEAYLQDEAPVDFQRIRDYENRIHEEPWIDGWTPTNTDSAFTDDVYFSDENDFVQKAPGGFTTQERYLMRWTGTLSVTDSGEYGFRTKSGDGSMLYINGEAIVDNDGDHGCSEMEGFVSLTAGELKYRLSTFLDRYFR